MPRAAGTSGNVDRLEGRSRRNSNFYTAREISTSTRRSWIAGADPCNGRQWPLRRFSERRTYSSSNSSCTCRRPEERKRPVPPLMLPARPGRSGRTLRPRIRVPRSTGGQSSTSASRRTISYTIGERRRWRFSASSFSFMSLLLSRDRGYAFSRVLGSGHCWRTSLASSAARSRAAAWIRFSSCSVSSGNG